MGNKVYIVGYDIPEEVLLHFVFMTHEISLNWRGMK